MTFLLLLMLLHFYGLNYLNSTKSRLSNKKSGMVTFDSRFKNGYCHQNFKSLSLKMTKLEGGGGKVSSPPNLK